MGFNQAVAERLDLMSRLMEVLGENSFRASAHARAARALTDSPLDLESITREPDAIKRLCEIEGVGPKIAEKVVEFAHTGAIADLAAMREQVPPGLLELMQISGLGPKTVQVLWKQGGVTDLESLRRALDDGTAAALPRMGEKSVQKIKASLSLLEESGKRLPLGLAVPVAERIATFLQTVPGVKRAAFAGSARRGKETVGDLDVLVASDDPAHVAQAFITMSGVTHVLSNGEKRASVRCRVNPDLGRWGEEGASALGNSATIQVDLRVVPDASWGAAMMYFTGSKEHNVRLRERAQKMGLTLNEYGLFPEDGEKEPPQSRGVKPVAGRTEEEVFAALGLSWIAPELREDQGEIDTFEQPAPASKPRAGKPGPPQCGVSDLVTLDSIRAELHAHTTASDGTLSIVELAQAAQARGFHTIAVTDHSKSSAIAGGLSPERLLRHIEAVHAAREHVPGITILAGSEVDILADGSLDYEDHLLGKLDTVVASPHASLSQEPNLATERLLRAISHPAVRILGHPTGRLINRRAGLAPDMARLIEAAIRHDVALEVNAHWMRLDLRDQFVRQAAAAGALIAINCDVHDPADFNHLRFGVQTARRGWLRADQCINTWDADHLHAWIARRPG